MPPKSKTKTPAKRKSKSATRREFSAGFLLFRQTPQGRLWLLLDYGRHWDYPKGHLEKDETAWQAAVRELREETGIRQVTRHGSFQKHITYVFSSPKKGPIFKTVTYFAGQTPTSEVTLSHEHTGYAWLPYEEAYQRLTYDNARELLQAAEATLNSPQPPNPKPLT